MNEFIISKILFYNILLQNIAYSEAGKPLP